APPKADLGSQPEFKTRAVHRTARFDSRRGGMLVRMTTEPGAETVPRDQDVHGALAAARAATERLTAVVKDLDDRLELVLAASHTGLWEWQIATGALIWSDPIRIQHGQQPGEGPKDFEPS